jgi:hypothetical protein
VLIDPSPPPSVARLFRVVDIIIVQSLNRHFLGLLILVVVFLFLLFPFIVDERRSVSSGRLHILPADPEPHAAELHPVDRPAACAQLCNDLPYSKATSQLSA